MIVLLLFVAVMTPYEVAFLQDSGTVGALFCVNIFLDFLFCLRMNPRAKWAMWCLWRRDVGRPLHSSCDKDVVQAHHTSNHLLVGHLAHRPPQWYVPICGTSMRSCHSRATVRG